MKVEVIKKDLVFTLSPQEAFELRKQVSEIQSQIIELTSKAVSILKKLIDNKNVKNVDVVQEIDETEIREYYDGQLINSIPISAPDKVQKRSLELVPKTPTPKDLESTSMEHLEIEEGPVFHLDSEIDEDSLPI